MSNRVHNAFAQLANAYRYGTPREVRQALDRLRAMLGSAYDRFIALMIRVSDFESAWNAVWVATHVMYSRQIQAA